MCAGVMYKSYKSAGVDKCSDSNRLPLTCSAFKYLCVRSFAHWSRALRRSLTKKRNFSEMEVVPLESEVEVKQGRGVWQHENWCKWSSEIRCLQNDDSGRSSGSVDEQTCCCIDTVMCVCVRTLLKRRCCSVVHQLLDIPSMTMKNQKTLTLTKRTRLLKKQTKRQNVRKPEIITPKTNQA